MMRPLLAMVMMMTLLPGIALADVLPDELAQITTLMASPPSLHGTFQQSKHLAALDTDIDSSGRFAYQRDTEIDWQTLEPVESLLKLTPERITSEQGGKILSELETRNNPVVALFSDIFFGVMTARWSTLSEHFEVQTSVTGKTWQATLTPKAAEVQRVVSQVELQGGQYITEIVLHEAEGDWTRIRFDNLQP
ncbi:outer membrane lipoprotein carrier protein LolA [Pokkaliibacter sp. CJK22405]|uniref:outer membrane lipoprotein carrier protein LolA n=1 Tax=Pokkaliibacter sp. CJK22405 TaxID=3384615 RepID=UPI0039852DF2